ncbi:filamin A-interacting protein 1-like [Zerene cesonia]|uniref:filamin A-interacting protein 1-like n=1 Tax=Zerene cesonia TaxID=33412 RepID=UPI0018E53EB2|nr:filamin A-interacting protein 1-like [Zerene cesonia]
MDENPKENRVSFNERLQDMIRHLSKTKIDFSNERDECRKLREINIKLESDLKETRELEKSHRYHLITSREMIANLQETVSQLVYLRRDVKKLKEEIVSKDSIISSLEKEKNSIIRKHDDVIIELRDAHEKRINEIINENEQKVQQMQLDSDTQLAQITCVIEELRSRIRDMETEQRDKMNVVVLEYEEKIQRSASQVAQLQEQLTRQAARADANIDAYRRKLEEVEEKLKQSQFKKYLAQSTCPSQYESIVERPYSVERDVYPNSPCTADFNSVTDSPKSYIPSRQNKTLKQSTLQVMYCDEKASKSNEKKGQFNITKKRKLYNEKDYLNT